MNFEQRIKDVSGDVLGEKGLYKKCIKELKALKEDTSDKIVTRRRNQQAYFGEHKMKTEMLKAT
jgi:hypothetical protein